MRKYLSFFRIRFVSGLQYRAAALAGVSTQFFWGFMQILLYRAFFRADPGAFPMEFSAFVSYVWLQQAFLSLFMTWVLDGEILNQVASGGIAYELCRPTNLYAMWMVKNMASRCSKALLRCIPVLTVAFLLPKPYRMSLPPDGKTALLFLLSMIMSFLLVNAFCMFVYILTFYTLSPVGVRTLMLAATELFTGSLIPLPFLPDAVERVFNLLPFGSMQNLPFRIYGGDIAGQELWLALAVQLVWVFIFILSGSRWTERVIKRAVVQGG